jgi:hypothetical protein
MQKVFNCYEDPGHSWVKVPRKLINELKVQVSTFSYQKGDSVYLEEDDDLSNFVIAFQAKYGVKPTFRTSWTNKQSKIRSYDAYRSDTDPKEGSSEVSLPPTPQQKYAATVSDLTEAVLEPIGIRYCDIDLAVRRKIEAGISKIVSDLEENSLKGDLDV